MKISAFPCALLLAASLLAACDRLAPSEPNTSRAGQDQPAQAPGAPAVAVAAAGTGGTDGAVVSGGPLVATGAASAAPVVTSSGAASQSASVQASAGLNAGLDVGECPASAADFKEGKLYTCSCPADVQADMVYGSGTYTMDSHICTAALHAGALQRSVAGRINVQMVASPEVFKSSTQNGIKSEPYAQAESAAFQVSAAK